MSCLLATSGFPDCLGDLSGEGTRREGWRDEKEEVAEVTLGRRVTEERGLRDGEEEVGEPVTWMVWDLMGGVCILTSLSAVRQLHESRCRLVMH